MSVHNQISGQNASFLRPQYRDACAATTYRSSWLSRTSCDIKHSVTTAVDRHLNTEAEVSKLGMLLESLDVDDETKTQLAQSITKVQTNAAAVSEFFSSMAHPSVYSMRVYSGSAGSAAQQVLCLPELLEKHLPKS